MRQTKIPTPNELRQHVIDLSKAFHIELLQLPGMPYEAAVAAQLSFFGKEGEGARGLKVEKNLNFVLCRPVVDESTYAVAMHEFGHVLHPTGRLQTPGQPPNWMLRLQEEESAWEWAEMNALDWSPTMEHVKEFAVSTYRATHRRIMEDKELRARAEFRRTHLPAPKKYRSMKDFLEDKPK